MAQMHMNKDSKPKERTIDKRLEAKDYEVKRARHDADMMQQLAEDEGMELIKLRKTLAEAKRHRLYERIGWLLLCISQALVQHL